MREIQATVVGVVFSSWHDHYGFEFYCVMSPRPGYRGYFIQSQILFVSSAQDCCSLGQGAEFLKGNLGGCDGTIREGSEAAIRVEVDPVSVNDLH